MIRTEYGQTAIRTSLIGEVKGDFACIVKSVMDCFMEEDDMTEEEAKEEIRRIVEHVFEYEEDEEDNDKTDELMDLLEELLKAMKEGKANE